MITGGNLMVEVVKGTKKEEFDLLVQHVTDIQKSFVENTAKVAGFLLLAMGWLATAKEARTFLSNNEIFAVIAAITVAVTYVLSVWASAIAYSASAKAIKRLSELSWLDSPAYENRALDKNTFYVCVIGNGALASVLAVGLVLLIV
jgi:hypothetical protein